MTAWALWSACRDPAPIDAAADHSAAPPVAGLTFTGERPTHLVIVSLDTTRRDHLGAFGGPVTTPFLDQRLAEGVVWADHRSCSNWTAPSMICAQTGRSPLDLGFWPGTGDPEVPGVPDALPTIARLWSRAGGRSLLVTGNAVFSSQFAADGFDDEVVLDYQGAKLVAEAAVEGVRDRQDDAPLYLHVHFMDPHRPYCPPEEVAPDLSPWADVGFDVCDELDGALEEWDTHDEAWRTALLGRVDATYRAELAWFDLQLAWMWGELDDAGLLDDALVVFHTDHGEQMMERGVVDHGFELHAEENRAAAGFWARGLAPARVELPTAHEDLGATVMATMGLEPAEPPTGLLPAQLTRERVRRAFAYSRADHGPPQLAVTGDGRALLRDWVGDGSYHDLEADPAELVEAPDDDRRAALEAELEAFEDAVRSAWPHLGGPGGGS